MAEALSVFDIFKIGVGPSSSHTMGPMTAAGMFLDELRGGADQVPGAGAPARLRCTLHGSLAFTGVGHATDRATILGLAALSPMTMMMRRPRPSWQSWTRPIPCTPKAWASCTSTPRPT